MIHGNESTAAQRRRLAIAGIAAVLLHAALLATMWRLASPEGAEPVEVVVELQITGGSNGPMVAKSPVPTADRSPTARSEPFSPREAARVAGTGTAKVSGEMPFGPAAPARVEPSDAGPANEPDAPLDFAFDWSGFERAFGERAAADREAYREALRKQHAEAHGFGRWHGLVLRALGANRSFSPLGTPLSSDEAQRAVADYLAILDSRITPEFNAFLVAAGAPNDLLHAKAQTGLLRYNPFYVRPPPGEFVDPGSVLRGINEPALTQFALTAQGDLSELRLVATSGSGAFDASALASIAASAPFPPPPGALLSSRDRAHFEWGFDKDLRRSGISNARHLVVMAVPETRGEEPDSGIEGPPQP